MQCIGKTDRTTCERQIKVIDMWFDVSPAGWHRFLAMYTYLFLYGQGSIHTGYARALGGSGLGLRVGMYHMRTKISNRKYVNAQFTKLVHGT